MHNSFYKILSIFVKRYLDINICPFFSVAIMIYLCNKYESVQDHWYLKDL